MCWIGSLIINVAFGPPFRPSATLPYEGTSTTATVQNKMPLQDQLHPTLEPARGLFYKQPFSLNTRMYYKEKLWIVQSLKKTRMLFLPGVELLQTAAYSKWPHYFLLNVLTINNYSLVLLEWAARYACCLYSKRSVHVTSWAQKPTKYPGSKQKPTIRSCQRIMGCWKKVF